MKTSGSKTIVTGGINWKKGINPKNTPISTKPKIAIATVAVIGKNSLLMLRDFNMPLLLTRLDKPPVVPLEKIW